MALCHPPAPATAAVLSPRQLNHAILRVEHDPEGLLSLVSSSVSGFDRVNCATALNRLSKAVAAARDSRATARRVARDPRTRQLLSRTAALLGICDARQLANIINGLAKLDIRPDGAFLSSFLQGVDRHMAAFTTQELANTLHSLAKLGLHPGPRLLSRLLSRASEVLPDANAQVIANLFNALARLEHRDAPPAFLAALTEQARQRLGHFSPQHMANTFNALARLGYDPGKPFMHDAMTVLLSRLPDFSPAELSCLINSLTKMHGPDPEADPDPDGLLPDAQLLPPQVVLASLLAATEPVLPSSSSRDLSCILNGLARLGHDPGDAYMAHLAERALQVSQSFTAQGLATSLNALARLPAGRAPPSLVRCLGDRTLTLLQRQQEGGGGGRADANFTPQGLSLVLLGLSKLGRPLLPGPSRGDAFLDAWLACATPLLPAFSAQHHSSTLYAFTLLGRPPPKPFLAALTAALRPLLTLPPASPLRPSAHQASLLLSCLPRLGHDPGPFFLHDLLQHCPRPHQPQDLALSLSGLASLLHLPPPSFWAHSLALLSRAHGERSGGGGLTLLDVSPVLWAVAVLDFPRDSWPVLHLLVDLLPALLPQDPLQPLDVEAAVQLYQLGMALATTPGRGRAVLGQARWASLRAVVQRAWQGHEGRTTHLVVSPAQKEVEQELRSLGCRVSREVPFGPYSIDLLALPPPPSERSEGEAALPALAVEVDGETHFISDGEGRRRPLGQTLLKRRAMAAYEGSKAWGLAVSVTVEEWGRAKAQGRAREALLEVVARRARERAEQLLQDDDEEEEDD